MSDFRLSCGCEVKQGEGFVKPCPAHASWLAKETEALRDEYNAACEEISYHELAAADRDRLVRELDVALNGEGGAAKRPALCDVVAQVKDERWKLVRA